MHIMRTNIADIDVRHLEKLVADRTRESEALEFKATLPFQSQKGQPQQADRWIEHGDRIGDFARDKILSEIVAFANANGGTLVIGVVESNDQPPEAVGLAPLPKCEELAQRLIDAAEDTIEPRLPSLVARGIPIDETGQGYVILRAGRSRAGPHRLNGKMREFYIRRGERAARMDVREIRGLTLELARSDERLEAAFESRSLKAQEKFRAMSEPASFEFTEPLVARISALPTLAEHIDGLTKRQGLWWQGGPFELQIEQKQSLQCSHPAREFRGTPRIHLRSLVDEGDILSRQLRADGLVEAVFTRESRPLHRHAMLASVYVEWLLSLLIGVLAQVEHVRRNTAGWDTVEFGLEVELWSNGPVYLLQNDGGWGGLDIGRPISSALPLTFPKYSVRDLATFDDLVNQFLQDLFNAWGNHWNDKGSVDWNQLLRR